MPQGNKRSGEKRFLQRGLLDRLCTILKLPIPSLHIDTLSGIGIKEALLLAISYQASKHFPLTSTDVPE